MRARDGAAAQPAGTFPRRAVRGHRPGFVTQNQRPAAHARSEGRHGFRDVAHTRSRGAAHRAVRHHHPWRSGLLPDRRRRPARRDDARGPLLPARRQARSREPDMAGIALIFRYQWRAFWRRVIRTRRARSSLLALTVFGGILVAILPARLSRAARELSAGQTTSMDVVLWIWCLV